MSKVLVENITEDGEIYAFEAQQDEPGTFRMSFAMAIALQQAFPEDVNWEAIKMRVTPID